jgi:hypothetical protein
MGTLVESPGRVPVDAHAGRNMQCQDQLHTVKDNDLVTRPGKKVLNHTIVMLLSCPSVPVCPGSTGRFYPASGDISRYAA